VGVPLIANIFNNIIVGSSSAGIRSLNTAGATIDFNDVFQNLGGQYVNVASLGTHNISANPLFLGAVQPPATSRPDPALANWRLGAFSPAIDSALGDEDLNGNGILDFGEDQNGNGRLDVPPAFDHDGNGRFDDPNVLDTGLGLSRIGDMGAFERMDVSTGGLGTRVAGVTAERVDFLMQNDQSLVALTIPNQESSSGMSQRDVKKWSDAVDDLLKSSRTGRKNRRLRS
jgi:hypothetical protein